MVLTALVAERRALSAASTARSFTVPSRPKVRWVENLPPRAFSVDSDFQCRPEARCRSMVPRLAGPTDPVTGTGDSCGTASDTWNATRGITVTSALGVLRTAESAWVAAKITRY